MFLHVHKKSGIIKEKDIAFQKEDDEMIVKPVNAGEKTMNEIKEMIKNLDDDTMISIDFSNIRFSDPQNMKEEDHE